MLIGPVLSQSYDLDLTCRLEDMILASKKVKTIHVASSWQG